MNQHSTNESKPTVGRRVRTLRASAGLTQKEFAERVLKDSSEHGFKRLSRIEKDAQELSDDDRGKIESHFSIRLESLPMVSLEADGEPELDVLTNDQYFLHHRNFIERAVAEWPSIKDFSTLGGPAEVWFFHPVEDLPVIKSRGIQERWLENLKAGVDKHLVWPLPVSTERDLKAFFDLSVFLLGQLAKLPPPQVGEPRRGEIVFWGCDPCAGSTNQQLAKFYEDRRESFERTKVVGLVVHPLLELPDDPRYQKLLRLESVILNRAASPALPPYAADFLEDVGSEPNEGGVSGWLFLGRSSRSRLDEIADRLQKMTPKRPQKNRT